MQTHFLRRSVRRFALGDVSGITTKDYYPSLIPGYVVDYDIGFMGVANGSPIGAITDRSGNGRNLTGVANPPCLITTAIGGNACANLNGSSQYFYSSFSGVLSQPTTYFVVAQLAPASNLNRFLFDGYTAAQPRNYLYRVSGGAQAGMGSSVGPGINPTWSWDALWRLWECHFTNTATSVLYVNGVNLGSGNCGSGAGSGMYGFVLGCRTDGIPASYGWAGGIARLIGYNWDVAGAELTNIRQYLRTKYVIY